MTRIVLALIGKLSIPLVALCLALANAPAWAVTYEYDALGRVVKVIYDDGSYVEYTYDAAGNRTVVEATES